MKKSLLLLLSLAVLAPAACKKNPSAEAPEEVVLRKREEAQRRAEFLLADFDRKLADLRARTEGSAKSDARNAVAALEEKKTRVQMKLDELKTSSKSAAKDVSDGLEGAVDDLERSYKDAAQRFK